MSASYVPVESLLQSRAFRRLLAFSLAGHVVVFIALVARPWGRARLISDSAVMVQMVSMPKAAAPPKAAPAKPVAPKAAPKPPEPPPKPQVKEIVIPKDVRALPEKPKPKPAETPPPSAEELLAKMTEKVEAEEAEQAADAPVSDSPPAPAAGSPGEFDPRLSPWSANVKARVRANWSGASVCKGAPMFDVDVDASGRVNEVKLTQSSGDSYCDDTAERAIRKSNPLPPPPYAATFELYLNPKDVQ